MILWACVKNSGAHSELIERAKAGDAAAMEGVLLSLAPAMRRFGLHMCRHRQDAEDALQDALLAVARHLPTYDGRASLSSWAFAITRSACARHHRGDVPHAAAAVPAAEALGDLADAAPSPEAQVAELELSRELSAALTHLPAEQREVVLLRDVEGMTAPEVAAALEISVEAVKSRLHRARGALREALQAAWGPVVVSAPSAPSTPAPATCPDAAALWSQKLEGDLSARDCQAMEAHLTSCANCRATCDDLRKALGACQAAGEAPVSPAVVRRVRSALAALARVA